MLVQKNLNVHSQELAPQNTEQIIDIYQNKDQQILGQQNFLSSNQLNRPESNNTQNDNTIYPIYSNIQNFTCVQEIVNINQTNTSTNNLVSNQQLNSTSTASPKSAQVMATLHGQEYQKQNALENDNSAAENNMAQNNNLAQNLDSNNSNLTFVVSNQIPNTNVVQNCVTPNGNNVHYILYNGNSNSVSQNTNGNSSNNPNQNFAPLSCNGSYINNGNCMPMPENYISNNGNFIPSTTTAITNTANCMAATGSFQPGNRNYIANTGNSISNNVNYTPNNVNYQLSNENYIQNVAQNTGQNLIANNEHVNLIQATRKTQLLTPNCNSNHNLKQIYSNPNLNLSQNSENINQNLNSCMGQISVAEGSCFTYNKIIPQQEVTPIYQNSQNSIQSTYSSNTCINAFVNEERTPVQYVNMIENHDSKIVSSLPVEEKIEALMDLVKKHLICTVMEDVNVLEHQILELKERIAQLEYENELLKNHYKRNA